ncbi:hypothetical protein APY94_09415 [Thermococcus celericrescens]|uniref:Uncharacterized protein n=1 Tax=Thermococcus celericrescens TaxID=227598 RepID=A0A100XWJ7_9EURY|nr:hypothetical protein APY94_09415 [Thermococcus celericrescens]
MVEFLGLLGEAWGKFEETKWLLPVPLVMSLMDYDKVIRTLHLEGFHFGIRFPLPEPSPTLWSFVSLPAGASGTTFSPEGLMFTALLVLFGSYLQAGYIGSIRDEVLMRDSSFLKNAERDFLEFLQFNLVLYAVMMLLILFLMALPSMFFSAFLGLMIFLYAIYGTPFLISIRGLKFRDALIESLNLAKKGGEYLDYALKYLAIGALISVLLTFIATNTGVFGFTVGLFLAAPISLTLSTATVIFFIDLTPKFSDKEKALNTPDVNYTSKFDVSG